MTSVGYGEKYWPDLESLVADARSATNRKEMVLHMRYLISAMAACGPVRVSDAAIQAHGDYDISFDEATQEYIITARNGR